MTGGRPDVARLTVVIATHNRAAYLPGALQSVLDQDVELRVRIFDDASVDGTAAYLAGLADDRIEVVRQPVNLGWLGNCNAALAGIDTEYVAMLGDDDVMHPGAMARALALLDSDPTVGMVHAAIDIIDADGRVVAPGVDWTDSAGGDAVEPGDEFIVRSMRVGCRVCAATVVFRREALPPTPFLPKEGPTADVGLWLRMATAWRIGFLSTPGSSYRVHRSSDSAQWSTPQRSTYVESTRMLHQILAMKLGFLDECLTASHLRRRLAIAAVQSWVRVLAVRPLGPAAVQAIREGRRRRAAHPPRVASPEGPSRLIVLCRQRRSSPSPVSSASPPRRAIRWLSTRVERNVGGVQVHVENLASLGAALGMEVDVATPYTGSWAGPVAAAAVGKALRTASPPTAERWRRWWQAVLIDRSLRRHLRNGSVSGPVVLYAQCAVTLDLALRRRKPWMATAVAAHSSGSDATEAARRGDCRPGDALYRRMERLERQLLPLADGLVAVSAASRADLLDRVPALRRTPSLVAHNFLPDDWGSEAVRPGRPEGDLITVGRLSPEKDHAYLLDIVAAMHRRGRPVTLTMVGEGPERPALEQRLIDLDLGGAVTLLGSRSDVADLLVRHRAYVHTASAEPFGIALIEAMSAGLPVAAVPVDGIVEVFDDGVQGWYLPAGDPPAAASILAAALGDATALARAGRAGRATVEQRFSEASAGEALVDFLEGRARWRRRQQAAGWRIAR